MVTLSTPAVVVRVLLNLLSENAPGFLIGSNVVDDSSSGLGFGASFFLGSHNSIPFSSARRSGGPLVDAHTGAPRSRRSVIGPPVHALDQDQAAELAISSTEVMP